MIEQLDPHKICQMDGQIDSLLFTDARLEKEMDSLKKEMDKLRSKNSFVASLQPTESGKVASPGKMRKEDIEDVVNECLVNNHYMKKIPTLESTVADFRLSGEQIASLEKRLSRMQKESDMHNLVYQMKGLEEYVKKEILIMGNRLTQLETQLKDEVARNKLQRPTSASRTLLNSRSNSTVNVKRLHPVNCIGCYETPGVFGRHDQDSDTYSRMKASTAMGTRRDQR